MERFFDALRPFIRAVVRHPLAVVGVALVLAALALTSASRLRIDTDLANLIPPEYPSVQAIERLRQTVGSESPVDIGIASPSFEANQAFAEALIPQMMALRAPSGEPRFSRYDYREDTTFLAHNALYFASDEELDQLQAFLEDQIDAARLAANPFFVDLDDDLGLDDEAAAGEDLKAALQDLQVREYNLSADSTVLAVRFFPTGAQTNIGFIEDTYRQVDSLLAAMDPAQFHPQMEVTAAGRLLRQLVEVEAITSDVQGSFGAGAGTVLFLVMLYFFYRAVQLRGRTRRVMLAEAARMAVTAVLIGLPLLMSLAWTFGVAQLAFGALNLMTSTLVLVLFGLSVDYGIHYYARYIEERGHGQAVEGAAETAFVSTGQAVAVSATTTAAALFVLMVADFRGFSEFGLIGGIGILFGFVAMLTVLPALIALAEQLRLLNLGSQTAAPSRISDRPYPAARGLTVVGFALALVSIVAIFAVPGERFEYDFGALEPEYRAYYERAGRLGSAFPSSRRRNPAYVVADAPAEVPAIAAALRERAAQDTLILSVETLQERFPTSREAAEAKLGRIAEIRALTEDPFLSQDPSGQIARIRRAASTEAPIGLDDVPENLKRQFTTKSGEVGTFVIVYPAVGLSDGRNSMAFAEAVGTVEANGKTYHAGSTSIVAAEMLRLMLAEAPLMIGLTFVLIALLTGLHFRSVKWTLLALLPIVVGVLWMLGLMTLFGVKLTFYNLVVLPAVLGIGVDSGVHIIHRYREEGLGSIWRIVRSTGEAISMAALTTMVGFAGQLLSFHPGLRSIGMLAVIGIGTTLVAALTFLPALLQWLEARGLIEPEGKAIPAA